MADMTIKFKAGQAKIKNSSPENFIQQTICMLHDIQEKREKSNRRLSCAMSCFLFNKKPGSGRQ